MFEVTNMPNYENFMKGIIMDVYLKDENKVINIEIQTTNHGNPPRMVRYYQAAPTSTPSRQKMLANSHLWTRQVRRTKTTPSPIA
ncbi:MAG: hypothetical protein J6C11_06540 [Spirochaetaceae bacterium]|nr:hypothetical protein [Spirochaetaceae bacterium]